MIFLKSSPMLNTNLLPHGEKKLIYFEELYRIVLLFASVLTGIFVVGSILLLPSYLPAVLTKRDLERRLALEKKASAQFKVEETISQIAEIEKTLFSIKTYVVRPQQASLLLKKFSEPITGIYIQNLTVTKDGSIALNGKAATRRDLLAFERKLRESGQFQQVISPPSNIAKESNINFTLEAKIKPEFGL